MYRDDDERGAVLEYCEMIQSQLKDTQYDGAPVRVRLDDRDIRGGEKNWYHVKRGVPLRVTVGLRDMAEGKLELRRRDHAPNEKAFVSVNEFIGSVAGILADMQKHLFVRALESREAVTRTIDDLDEFTDFFTPENADQPEIHGGLALCHFSDGPEMEEKLKALKVSARCIPIDAEEEAGRCLFSGRESKRRGVFAKAY
jgi:prolyl-tRNA synthetase